MDDQNQQPTQPAGDQGGMPQAPVQPEPEAPSEEPSAPAQEPTVPQGGEPSAPVSEPSAPEVPSEQPGGNSDQGGQQPGGTL